MNNVRIITSGLTTLNTIRFSSIRTDSATSKQIQVVNIALNRICRSITTLPFDRTARLTLLGYLFGKTLETSNQLEWRDAHSLIDWIYSGDSPGPNTLMDNSAVVCLQEATKVLAKKRKHQENISRREYEQKNT